MNQQDQNNKKLNKLLQISKNKKKTLTNSPKDEIEICGTGTRYSSPNVPIDKKV